MDTADAAYKPCVCVCVCVWFREAARQRPCFVTSVNRRAVSPPVLYMGRHILHTGWLQKVSLPAANSNESHYRIVTEETVQPRIKYCRWGAWGEEEGTKDQILQPTGSMVLAVVRGIAERFGIEGLHSFQQSRKNYSVNSTYTVQAAVPQKRQKIANKPRRPQRNRRNRTSKTMRKFVTF